MPNILCRVCGETDTAEDWCKCIICDCGTKTHDKEIVFHKTEAGMYCSVECRGVFADPRSG